MKEYTEEKVHSETKKRIPTMPTDRPHEFLHLTLTPHAPEDVGQSFGHYLEEMLETCMGFVKRRFLNRQPQEEAMAKDTLGRMISIGDTVAYAVRDGNTADLKIGDVVYVQGGRICVEAKNFGGRLTKRTLSHLDRVAVLHSPTH